MAYQVLARKYRPQKFSEVVGQEHVTQTLANAIAQNRIAHAYLFVGPRGTGKTTLARIFAKCLNCSDGPKVDFTDDDPRCREIIEGRSLDVIEIDGASNRGIEEIRSLRETVKYVPASSKYKIYIIDEVHMLTKEAFNALLKTLEEPPPHVKFMFATTEPEKVLPTILSRCQRFDLRRIPAALIVNHLAQIAALEKVEVDHDALLAIARGADGGMRDAESALDQLISFCRGRIVEADVLSMFGLTAQRQVILLAEAIIAGQAELILRQLNDLAKNGKDLGRLLAELLDYFRNLLVFQVSRGDTTLIESSEVERTSFAAAAPQITPAAVTRIMELLTDCESRLRQTPSKKILLEVTLLKAIQMRQAVNLDAVLEKLQQLRPAAAGTGHETSAPRPAPPAPAGERAAGPSHPISAPPAPPAAEEKKRPPASPAEKPERPPAEASPRPAATRLDLPELWAQVVAATAKVSQFLRSYLLEAHPVSFEKNILTIGFDPEFADHLSLVDVPKTRTILATKLQEITGQETQVRFIRAERPPAAMTEPPAAASTVAAASQTSAQGNPKNPPATVSINQEEISQDPLIKQALELFKGQIVEVRA